MKCILRLILLCTSGFALTAFDSAVGANCNAGQARINEASTLLRSGRLFRRGISVPRLLKQDKPSQTRTTSNGPQTDQVGGKEQQSTTLENPKPRLSRFLKMLNLGRSGKRKPENSLAPSADREPTASQTQRGSRNRPQEISSEPTSPAPNLSNGRASRTSSLIRNLSEADEARASLDNRNRLPTYPRIRAFTEYISNPNDQSYNTERYPPQAEVAATLHGPGYIRTMKSGAERELITVPAGHSKEVSIRDPKYAAIQAEMTEDPAFPSYTRRMGVAALGHKVSNRVQRGFGTKICHLYTSDAELKQGASVPDGEQSCAWRYRSRTASALTGASSVARSGLATLEAEAIIWDPNARSPSTSRRRSSNDR